VAPIATGTPIPSTADWTVRRSSPGSTWYAVLIDVLVVPSVSDVDDPGGCDEHEQGERGFAPGARRHEHRHCQHRDEGRIRRDSELEAEAPQQEARHQGEEEHVDQVEDDGVLREEVRQVGGVVVPRRRSIEDEVLDQLRPGGGEHLVGDDEGTNRVESSRRSGGRGTASTERST
jgi:hypothetical protein